ncbi:hypothetical protein ACVJGD_000974 [Bradyrhizobium sp. USDA 10063]
MTKSGRIASTIDAALPLPLAGEGWGGGISAMGLFVGREPSPAALFERIDLPRKRGR